MLAVKLLRAELHQSTNSPRKKPLHTNFQHVRILFQYFVCIKYTYNMAVRYDNDVNDVSVPPIYSSARLWMRIEKK